MVPVAPIFKRAYSLLVIGLAVYTLALIALANPWLQRNALYAHKIQTWWVDANKPEMYGFAKNQITPFNFTTPDRETLHAWHVMPIGLYSKHEAELLQQPSGCAEDITDMKAFQLLRDDPESRLIITFHGNAGNVAQGWRADSYRSLGDVDTSRIHILAIDYRGYGQSSGTPTEEGLIIDGIATVDWAMRVAKLPADRIVILGHSLGTAVTAAVAEHYAEQGIEFAGIVLVAAFSDLAKMLTSYAIGGWVPALSPLGSSPRLWKLFASYIVDRWPSATRLANFVRVSKRVRLFFIHSRDDCDIPWTQTEELFAVTANATTEEGMDFGLLEKMKARSTIDMGDGAFVSTWKAGGDKIIREEIVSFGHHSRVLTYTAVSLAIAKAFGLDNGGVLP